MPLCIKEKGKIERFKFLSQLRDFLPTNIYKIYINIGKAQLGIRRLY